MRPDANEPRWVVSNHPWLPNRSCLVDHCVTITFQGERLENTSLLEAILTRLKTAGDVINDVIRSTSFAILFRMGERILHNESHWREEAKERGGMKRGGESYWKMFSHYLIFHLLPWVRPLITSSLIQWSPPRRSSHIHMLVPLRTSHSDEIFFRLFPYESLKTRWWSEMIHDRKLDFLLARDSLYWLEMFRDPDL